MSPPGGAQSAGQTDPAYRIDGASVTAQAFYAAACDPGRSVVIEACAGAGKTWMLVSRILRALLEGAQPHEILAITFTRKAAAEMRSRLDEWLTELSEVRSGAAGRIQALVDRGLDPRQAAEAQAELGRLHEAVLQAGRPVEVRTFHAWFAQLLSQAPLSLMAELDLPVAYETVEDPTLLRDALMRRFHRRVEGDPALRADYLGLVARHRRGTVAQWLDAAWDKAPELARAEAAGLGPEGVPPAAVWWPELQPLGPGADPAGLVGLEPLARDIGALARELGAAAKGRSKPETAARGLREALDAAARGDSPGAFAGAWAALHTSVGEPRKQLGDSPLQHLVLAGLARVHSMRLQQAGHEDHAAMWRLAGVLRREYTGLKRQRGLVDMADLERAAETLLSRSELSGWVQERLDQRLRHVLIDEFQDTSPLQWQALHGWLSAYSGAGGGASGQRPPSVFMVGDPKQSIYRFRGADPRIFEAARDFVVVGLQGQVLECDHTRRNAPAVVAALNTVFARAGSEEGWGPFREHSTGSKVAGHVRRLRTAVRQAAEPGRAAKPAIWRDSLTQARDEPDRQVRAEEATCIAQAVAQLIQAHGLSPGEIIVLARRRSVLAFVAEALGAAALPHLVAEPLALKTSPEALDLIAVLDVLASPGHDLALARALKSPLFAASDDDLLTLSQAARGGPHWLATLLQTDQWHSVALGRARALLSAWSRAALVLPPHDLLDRIVHEGDLMARLVAAVPPTRRKGALQAVHALLGSSLAQQGGRFASIYGFVREFRAGRLRGTGVAPVDAVQLLTVHGAKGLEARAVIVADADPVPRPTERASVLVDWPVESEAPVGVAFLGKHSALPPSAAELWQAEQRAKDREELNGLYVAMTRAREWLLFSRTPPSRPATGASWWQRVVEQAAPWPLESDATPSVDITQAIAAPAVPIRLPTSVPVLPEFDRPVEPAPPVPAAQGPAARLGQAVHRLLEWAGHPGSPLPPDQRPAAAAAAAASFGLAPGDGAEAPDAATQVLQLAEQILLSPACSRFFTGRALIWAANEVPLASAGSVLRVDRLVALAEGTDTIWWVLDYKLHGAPQGVDAYRAQMALYVAAVQTLQPGDRVRGAFITGDGKCIEI